MGRNDDDDDNKRRERTIIYYLLRLATHFVRYGNGVSIVSAAHCCHSFVTLRLIVVLLQVETIRCRGRGGIWDAFWRISIKCNTMNSNFWPMKTPKRVY